MDAQTFSGVMLLLWCMSKKAGCPITGQNPKKPTPRSMIRDGFFIDAESYGEAL